MCRSNTVAITSCCVGTVGKLCCLGKCFHLASQLSESVHCGWMTSRDSLRGILMIIKYYFVCVDVRVPFQVTRA